MKKQKIIIITGLSGSGKSTALEALEDNGFYCVDNMPVVLLPKFLELPGESSSEIAGLAFGMDIRERKFLSNYESVFENLRKNGYLFEIFFLEADNKILIQRFSQTRRNHPLSQNKTLVEGILAEIEQFKPLREVSDKVINTSNFNVHELKSVIVDIAKKSIKHSPLKISVLSFGFKYGIPNEADLIVDVRFLSNPYFVPELKMLDGEKEEVKNYVLNTDEAKIFLKKYLELLDYLIPLYEKEGKTYLTIAIGCTGGRHRSVVIASIIYNHIANKNKQVIKIHRDISQG
ncbi:MAG: RNase adapter RapZ [Desulfobacterales bacterium]|nr:RNase adapter RapZ [Desulfobacterales bacterium]MBF0398148.1 RNase adapter RapZ [Desulfobacterales bacterium]